MAGLHAAHPLNPEPGVGGRVSAWSPDKPSDPTELRQLVVTVHSVTCASITNGITVTV